MLIDAQAQLNQGGSSASAGGNAPEFTEHQQGAVSDIITLAHNVSTALAADNVEQFNGLTASVAPAVEHLATAFGDASDWRPTIDKLKGATKLQPAKDLKDARRMFQPFADAVVDVTRRARQRPAFATLRVFRCPMTDQAYPGAPKSAMWIQTNSPLRNPFFGSEMIDCGTEVK
jgi:Cu(I)/Ag(I) efflux system membrane fusion protein